MRQIFMFDLRDVNPLEYSFKSKGNFRSSDLGGIAWTFKDGVFATGHGDGYVRLFDCRKISSNMDSDLSDYILKETFISDSSNNFF